MKTSTLKDALTNRPPATPPEAPPPAAPIPAPVKEISEFFADMIAGIEIEAVVGGALQRIRFNPGTDPTQVKMYLQALDPTAKVRDDFPSRNFGNAKNTKTARAMTIIIKSGNSGTFVDLVCVNGKDLTISVSKKRTETFPADLTALNKLSPSHLEMIQNAWRDKTPVTVSLRESEQFGVAYWTTEDGRGFFMDSLTAEPPAPIEKEAVA